MFVEAAYEIDRHINIRATMDKAHKVGNKGSEKKGVSFESHVHFCTVDSLGAYKRAFIAPVPAHSIGSQATVPSC